MMSGTMLKSGLVRGADPRRHLVKIRLDELEFEANSLRSFIAGG